jgi:hypothetical protein
MSMVVHFGGQEARTLRHGKFSILDIELDDIFCAPDFGVLESRAEFFDCGVELVICEWLRTGSLNEDGGDREKGPCAHILCV